MPRAKDFREAYNNFYVEPLKSNQELAEFYVERPGVVSPMIDLKDRIELAARKEKYLFLGFRGSGKSTELCRLEAALDESRFLVVNYSVRELNLSDFDFRDFFIYMVLKVYDFASEKGIPIHPDIMKDLHDFIKGITNITEEEALSQSSKGLSFSKILTLKLSREAETRHILRTELDQKISELIQRLNWLILDIENKSEKELVVIVDDLDKLARGRQSEDFFYKNYQLLLEPNCFVVYTFPMALTFHPNYRNIEFSFGGSVVLLQIPVTDRNMNYIEDNLKFYRQVITNRMEISLIDKGALEYAIESTGLLTELIETIKEATLNAFRKNREKIVEEDIEFALNKMRLIFDRILTENHKRKLLEIYETKKAREDGPESTIIRELIFSLNAIEYQDREGIWYDINPILQPLLRQWKIPQ